MKPVNDHCCNADDPNVCRGQYVATEQNGVGLGGKLGRPRFREFPPRPIPNEHFPAFAPDPRSLIASPLIWKKIVAFSKQIQGWKCKLMIWSFNHSGANPDAEEFPADSGSSDFTNPRQHKPWNSSNLRMCGCVCVFVCVFVCSVFLCLVCLCRYVVLSVLKIHNSKVCCN